MMKRMVLIPEERLLRYERRDKETNEVPEEIIQRGGEDDDDEMVRGIPKNMKAGAKTLLKRLKEKEDDEDESLTTEMIVRGIPKTMKTRAIALLDRLKERRDVITWDDKGQVTLNRVFIPKSNISDLISDAMRPRKHFNPKGVREFYTMLNEINIPKDLVRNDERWGELEEKKNVAEKKTTRKVVEKPKNWISLEEKKNVAEKTTKKVVKKPKNWLTL